MRRHGLPCPAPTSRDGLARVRTRTSIAVTTTRDAKYGSTDLALALNCGPMFFMGGGGGRGEATGLMLGYQVVSEDAGQAKQRAHQIVLLCGAVFGVPAWLWRNSCISLPSPPPPPSHHRPTLKPCGHHFGRLGVVAATCASQSVFMPRTQINRITRSCFIRRQKRRVAGTDSA